MGIFNFRNNKMLGKPLCVSLCCGIAGVLIDADHLIAYYYIQVQGGRFSHTAVFFLSCAVLCMLVTYLGRLVLEDILKKGV
jgi:hypothetical protein